MNAKAFSRNLANPNPASANTPKPTSSAFLAERKLLELHKKISEFQQLAKRLEALVDSPCRRTPQADCSVVAALKTGSCSS